MAIVASANRGLAAAARGATLLQLRMPGAATGTIAAEAARLAAESPIPVLVSRRVDVALAYGTGVHLPERDLPPAAVRRLLPHALIGRSVHDLAGARDAVGQGADYVLLGPVFPTPTHPGAPALGPERFQEIAAAVPVPVLAVGGLDRERAERLGAAGFAAIRAFSGS